VLSGRGLCDELITRPEESYRLCCVVVCDLETSRIDVPNIYDISSPRVYILRYLLYGFCRGFLTKHCFVPSLRDSRARLGTRVIDICENNSTPLGCSQSGSGIVQLLADLLVYMRPHIVLNIYFI
jgi:hypothetical protein